MTSAEVTWTSSYDYRYSGI